MASFLKLLLTFLLLNVLSDSQTGAGNLSCSKHNIAELGKPIKIKCKNNKTIIKMGVEFYSNNSTKQNANLTGVETEKQNSMAFLVINQTKMLHEGNYDLTYVAEDGMGVLTISLEVFAPYTSPQVMIQKDTLICTTSGGYPEEKLYWISKAGTKLTLKSTSKSVKNEDGSFNLSNILQLEFPPSETEYCCTFNNTRVPSRQPAPTCMAHRNVINSMITAVNSMITAAVKTTPETTRIIGIPVVFISLAFGLLAVFCYRKRKKNASSAKKMVSQELMVLIAEEGQSINLTCKFMHTIEGLYLKRTFAKPTDVLFITYHGKNKKEDSAYKNRTEYFEVNNTATITLKQLKENDSDGYMCTATLTTDTGLKLKNSPVKFLLVVKAPSEKNFESPRMLYIFISVLMLLVFMLGSYIICHAHDEGLFRMFPTHRGLSVLLPIGPVILADVINPSCFRPLLWTLFFQIKKCFQQGHAKKRQNFIYEDMTYSLRCQNTENKKNQYAM